MEERGGHFTIFVIDGLRNKHSWNTTPLIGLTVPTYSLLMNMYAGFLCILESSGFFLPIQGIVSP